VLSVFESLENPCKEGESKLGSLEGGCSIRITFA
jgi:hypothetical protein